MANKEKPHKPHLDPSLTRSLGEKKAELDRYRIYLPKIVAKMLSGFSEWDRAMPLDMV